MQLKVTQKRAMSHFGSTRRLEHILKLELKEVGDNQVFIGCVVACTNLIQTVVLKNTLVTFAHNVPRGGMEKRLAGRTDCRH
jgi:hypothetical protein